MRDQRIVMVMVVGFLLSFTGAASALAAEPLAEPAALVLPDAAPEAEVAAPECAIEEADLAQVTGIDWVAMSCSSDCTDAYLVCMDDCDAWPYPGCYQDCRNALNACRFACF